jgi:hypothetical protein
MTAIVMKTAPNFINVTPVGSWVGSKFAHGCHEGALTQIKALPPGRRSPETPKVRT